MPRRGYPPSFFWGKGKENLSLIPLHSIPQLSFQRSVAQDINLIIIKADIILIINVIDFLGMIGILPATLSA